MLLTLSMLLVSCNSSSENPASNPGNSLTGAIVGIVEDAPLENKEELPYNIWVQELKLKGKDVNEYRYAYRSQYLNSNGLIIPISAYNVYIKGDKVRKVYLQPVKLNGAIYYDNVYLDHTKKTAFGICVKGGITCEEVKEKYFPLSYSEQQLDTTPVELINGLDRYSKSTRQMRYSNRQVTFVESELPDSKTERLYVDEFFGLPLYREVFQIIDGKELVLEEQDFYPVIAPVGSVDIEEVTLSSKLTLLER